MSVGRWTLAFLAFSTYLGVYCITAPAQMLELACFLTAPAHPHATSVAVYPALFFFQGKMKAEALSFIVIVVYEKSLKSSHDG